MHTANALTYIGHDQTGALQHHKLDGDWTSLRRLCYTAGWPSLTIYDGKAAVAGIETVAGRRRMWTSLSASLPTPVTPVTPVPATAILAAKLTA